MAVNKYGLTTSLDIDRKNNSGGYFKSNIRFVPRVVNIRNRANTVMVELSGEKSMPLAKACEMYGISYTKAYNRIRTLGWSHDQAFDLVPRSR